MATIYVNGASKKGQELLARAKKNEGNALWQVYGRCSLAKQRAWQLCAELCEVSDGENLRIISHNGWSFSVAWEYTNKETGEVMTRIQTSKNTYIIDSTRAKED